MKSRIVAYLVAAVAAAVFLSPVSATADNGDCGQPQSTGSSPTASDALAVLKSAVGLPTNCDTTPCVCDVNGNGSVTSSDALQVLQAAVGAPGLLACDCDAGACVTFGNSVARQASESTLGNTDIRPRQVFIETKLVGVHLDSFDELGVDLSTYDEASITTSDTIAPGGTNDDGRTLAVDSNAVGGPADLQYLLYADHNADGALPILNLNFNSPFDAIKTFFLLPPPCGLFDESVVSEPQGFPGVDPVDNVTPYDVGLGGGGLLYDSLAQNEVDVLLSAIQGDTRNDVLQAPSITVLDGQSVIHMVDDVEPAIDQIAPDFRTNIQAVTPSPFGNFTGVALDVTPSVNIDDTITLTIRPSTQAASFFFSTAFQVDGVSADAEIPVLRRSLATTSVTVTMGQTIVIAGLRRPGETEAEKGLPFLGDLPIVGTSFFHKQFDPMEQTLIIFITPMIAEVN